MISLGLSTVTKTTSICLMEDEQLLGEVNVKQDTVDNILELISLLLNSLKKQIKDIDELVVVNGPGSYAGIRIGLTTIKTISLVNSIPIKVINSIELLAFQCRVFRGLIVVAMEARKDEVNFGMFGGNPFNEVLPSTVIETEKLFKKIDQIKGDYIIVGDLLNIPEMFLEKFHFATPLAKDAIILAKDKSHTPLNSVAPYYSYPVNINVKSKKIELKNL